MSLHHRFADPVVGAVPETLFSRECSQQMQIAFAIPARQEDQTRARESVGSHQETIKTSGQWVERTTLQPPERDVLLAAIPSLRAFAISLSGNVDRADDLVQGTLMRALANIDTFQPGTNMLAWLFTILRNLFHSEFRKRRREVEDADGSYADSLSSAPQQHAGLEFKELLAALAKLPLVQREPLLLVGASGFSYEEAAAICGVAVGTIKSRVKSCAHVARAAAHARYHGGDDTNTTTVGERGSAKVKSCERWSDDEGAAALHIGKAAAVVSSPPAAFSTERSRSRCHLSPCRQREHHSRGIHCRHSPGRSRRNCRRSEHCKPVHNRSRGQNGQHVHCGPGQRLHVHAPGVRPPRVPRWHDQWNGRPRAHSSLLARNLARPRLRKP